MHIDVSLDLETWGTTPGCDIRSIGACVFDPQQGRVDQGGELGTFYRACDNPIVAHVFDGPDVLHYPLTRDSKTVQWWNDQSDEARAAFADPINLRDALFHFSCWLNNITPVVLEPGGINDGRNIRLWSHGAAFDPPILAAAYAAVGLPVPWHYRAPRDTRTIFDAAGITDHSAWLKQHPGPMGVPHHALNDSICQARAVCAAYERITPHRRAAMHGILAMIRDDAKTDPEIKMMIIELLEGAP